VDRDPLALEPAAMREMGYRVVDLLVERISHLRDEPVLRVATRAEMEGRIHEAAPELGVPFEDLLGRLDRDVLSFVGHFDHPRFFGYIPGAGTWPAALGDLIAAATNIDAGAWREAAGASQLELTVLDWFREWIGYPKGAAGVLVSGGSAANMTALACAREILVGPMSPSIVAYTSDQTHSSLARAARHLGFRPDQIRVLPTDEGFRIRPADVAAAMDADIAAGRLPFLVSANAGTTNTGAIDPLPALAEICRARRVWLHVDGAYGAFAALTARGRAALEGLEQADSVTLDPHKWLAMPFEVGCLMVRDGPLLERAFELHPEYLQEAGRASGVNFADRGLQLTRAARSIKVWLAIQVFGLEAFRAAIDRALDQVIEAQRLIEADPRLELVTPGSLGVLTFRQRALPGEEEGDVDRRNESIVAELAASGDVLLTGTTIRGRYAIRLCVLNHTSAAEDVAYAVDRVATARPKFASPPVSPRAPRDQPIGVDWLGGHDVRPRDLQSIPVFAALSDAQATHFLGTAREEQIATGGHVTDRWALSRTFFIVLEGRLSVRIDDLEVNVLGPGSYLGEIAAIDWGRDFSYGRSATVVATEATRLLAFPASALREVMAGSREVDRELRRVAQTRLSAGAGPATAPTSERVTSEPPP